MITKEIAVEDINEIRFWNQVDRSSADACWPWLGHTAGSYGKYMQRVAGKKRNFTAHRVAYVLQRGQIPDGAVLDHLCRNRLCVNPGHLEPVTQRENNARGRGVTAAASRNWTNGICGNGHDLTQVGLHKQGSGWTCAECGRDRVRRYKARKTEAVPA